MTFAAAGASQNSHKERLASGLTIHRGQGAMSDPTEFRRKAAQARRAAAIRTVSGQAADRQLLALAIKLEHLADDVEKRDAVTQKKQSS